MEVVRKPKRTDIQALRFIAVMAVVVYHLWPNRLIGGFMGVDVFFVISGYLMTISLLRHINPVLRAKNKVRTTGNYLLEFYARRIKRLVPAASITLLATLALAWLTGSFSIIESTSKQVIAAALFFQNLFLANESVNYLAASTPPTAVQHFWSLSLEEQFYLMWPLVLLAISLFTIHLSIMYKKQRISGAILPVVVFTVISFIYGYLLTQSNQPAAYFVTFARVWELLLGAVVAFLPVIRNYDLKLLLPWLGTVMISYALFKWGGASFPGWHALVPTIGTAMILYAGTSESESKWSFSHLLRFRPIQWVGDISYSLYLWHWPLIILLPIILSVNIDGTYGRYIKLGILVLSFIMAWLSYKYIEQPSQKWQPKKRWIYISFFAVIILVPLLSFASLAYSGYISKKQLRELHQYAQSNKSTCLGARAIFNKDCPKSFNGTSRFTRVGELDEHSKSLKTGIPCRTYQPHVLGEQKFIGDICYVGDLHSQRAVVIWGDSHATHWISALDYIGLTNKIKFIIASSGVCASAQLNIPECQNRLKAINDSGILSRGYTVIISILAKGNSKEMLYSTENAIKFVRNNTMAPVYLLEDVPPATLDGGPRCKLSGRSCRSKLTTSIAPTLNMSNSLINKGVLDKKDIIPTYDMFCDKSYCYSVIGGLQVYSSNGEFSNYLPLGNSHISATYSFTAAPILESRLRAHGAIP
jgi:peptidoglycan/LPS O-acetylase OafA/YrhL